MNAKEFWISKYPDAEEDWGKTGHDDRFQVRMMEEYAEYRVKNCLIADVGGNEVALCRCGQPISVTECDDCLDGRIISELES
tara:strand:+ start:93 stop:338 length:246 start_codon:yes stop_codon:yes gene_type:complete